MVGLILDCEDSEVEYQVVTVPDDVAANVLSVNNTIIMSSRYPESVEVVRRFLLENDHQRSTRLVTVDMGELEKADGALTCCSLIFTT